jgi:hypothetical protein
MLEVVNGVRCVLYMMFCMLLCILLCILEAVEGNLLLLDVLD